VPPELLGLSALTGDDLEFVRKTYIGFGHDLTTALRFADVHSPHMPEEVRAAALRIGDDVEPSAQHLAAVRQVTALLEGSATPSCASTSCGRERAPVPRIARDQAVVGGAGGSVGGATGGGAGIGVVGGATGGGAGTTGIASGIGFGGRHARPHRERQRSQPEQQSRRGHETAEDRHEATIAITSTPSSAASTTCASRFIQRSSSRPSGERTHNRPVASASQYTASSNSAIHQPPTMIPMTNTGSAAAGGR